MSTLYCSFSDAATALRLAAAILEDGVMPDDISVLTQPTHDAIHRDDIFKVPVSHLTDATDFVGAADDPHQQPDLNNGRAAQLESSFEESAIGGGISTATPDDSIASVDQSDDSQSLAEEQSFGHPSEEVFEESDVERSLVTGFPTNLNENRDDQAREESTENLDASLETLVVPGVGVVMGGGELATAALAVTDRRNLEPIRAHLRDQGVKSRMADDLIEAFMNGGTVLAIALTRGRREESVLEELMLKGGAEMVETVGAPRF